MIVKSETELLNFVKLRIAIEHEGFVYSLARGIGTGTEVSIVGPAMVRALRAFIEYEGSTETCNMSDLVALGSYLISIVKEPVGKGDNDES